MGWFSSKKPRCRECGKKIDMFGPGMVYNDEPDSGYKSGWIIGQINKMPSGSKYVLCSSCVKNPEIVMRVTGRA